MRCPSCNTEKVVKNGEVYLRLTSKGSDKIKQDIPLFKYSNQRWDGYWRLVIFDIPEKRKVLRDVLRRKLVSLGLGRWQKSVYITPFNLEEEINQFLTHLAVDQHVAASTHNSPRKIKA